MSSHSVEAGFGICSSRTSASSMMTCSGLLGCVVNVLLLEHSVHHAALEAPPC